MCGATQQQKQITDEQQQFYKTLSDQYTQIFGQSQAITSALTSAFLPIIQAGPSQTGFAPSQETAMRTQNTENVSTDYAQAQRATAQILAARGGGNTMLPSSVTSTILAQNANAAAAQRAQGENQITQANYQQGYQNWQTAAGVLGSTAQLINPNAYAGSATTAGGAAATSANQIAAANFAPWGAAAGALGAVGGGALAGGYIPKPCWIAAELYGGWYEPRTVLIRKWLQENFTGHWLMNLYLRYGESAAAMIRKHSSFRWIFTPIFNQFLRQASR
jgi:hypothetical protein